LSEPRIIEHHPDIVLDTIDLIGVRLAHNQCPACGLALSWQGKYQAVDGAWWDRYSCRDTVKCGFERWRKVEETV